MVNYYIQNWQSAFETTFLLYQKIVNSFKPDVIIAIARGGWIPARLLADFFGIRETINIKVEAYHEIGADEVVAEITQDLTVDITNKKVLIVDDIADSGASILSVQQSIRNSQPQEVKFATLFYKRRSKVKPDYYIKETEDWVVFPWEIYETIKEISNSMKSEMQTSEIIDKLKEIGLPPTMVDRYFQS